MGGGAYCLSLMSNIMQDSSLEYAINIYYEAERDQKYNI